MAGASDASIAIALKFLDEATSPMKSALNQIKSNTASTQGAIEGLAGSFGRLIGTIGGISAAIASIKKLGTMGTEFNADIEGATVGIGALLAAQGKFVDAQGKELTGREKINAALSYSGSLVQQLQIANLKTTATMQQLIKAFQVTLSPGLAEGLSVSQITDYTLAMVQAASAMQIPLDMMAEETRSLLKGTITPRNTLIATALGITPDDIRKLKGDSEGLFKFVMGKLKEFTNFGDVTANTYTGLMSNAKDAFSFILGKATFPFFTELKAALKEFIAYAIQLDETTGKISINPELVGTFELLNDTLSITLGLLKVVAAGIATIGGAYKDLKSVLPTATESALQIREDIDKQSLDMSGIVTNTDEQRLARVSELIKKIAEAQQTISNWKAGGTAGEILGSLQIAFAKLDESSAISALVDLRKQMTDAGQSTTEFDDAILNLKIEMSKAGQDTAALDKALHEMGLASAYASDQQQDAGKAVRDFGFSADNATLSAAKFKDVLQELAGINLDNLGHQLDKSIVELEARAKAAAQGLSRTAQTTEGEYASKMRDIDIAEYYAKYNKADPATLTDLAGKRLKIEREKYLKNYIEGANEYWKEARKKERGAGPVDVDRIDQDLHRFREKMKTFYREISNLDDEYESARLEASGYYYEAEEVRMKQHVSDQKAAFAKEVSDAEQAYLEMQQKLATKKGATAEAQAEVAKLAQEWEDAKARAEEYGAKVDRNAAQQLEISEKRRQLSGALDLAQVNREYADLAGTMADVYDAEIALINASEAEKLANVNKNIPGLEEAYKKLYSAQKKLAELYKSGSFMEGFSQSYKDILRQASTGAEYGKAFAEDFHSAMESEFKSFFSDLLSGEFTSAEDAFASFGEAMADAFNTAFSNYLSKVLTNSFDSIMSSISSSSSGSSGGGILSWLGSLFSSGSSSGFDSSAFSFNFGAAHSGWIVGSGQPPMSIAADPSIFSKAPRLHSGLAADEYPAILQSGEEVVSRSDRASILKELRSRKKADSAAGGGQSVSVNITNKGSGESEVKSANAKFNGQEWIIDVIVDDVNRGGRIWKLLSAKGR